MRAPRNEQSKKTTKKASSRAGEAFLDNDILMSIYEAQAGQTPPQEGKAKILPWYGAQEPKAMRPDVDDNLF